MSEVVLDASAVLEVVRSEPGHERLSGRMNGSVMPAVNYSEVIKKSIEHGGNADVTAALLDRAQSSVVPVDVAQARPSAAIWTQVKSSG